jgi:predicted 2-oxoglutarate/Fe(II)-dependent dioxygenase YbiX
MIYPGTLPAAEIVAGCVAVYENAFPNWQQAIEICEREAMNPESYVTWTKAETIGDGIYQDKRLNLIMGVTSGADMGNEAMRAIHNQAYFSLSACLNDYVPRFNAGRNLIHEPYGMLKYRGGEHYKAHADGGAGVNRVVSAVIYMNDDYDGGELEFTRFGIKIKPLPGMCILFPSNFAYEHVAHPVLSGTKYALVTWLRETL